MNAGVTTDSPTSHSSASLPARPRVVIVGAGAVGGYYGARLAQHGHDVAFLLRSDLEHVKRHGFNVESCAGDFTLPPDRFTAAGTPEEIGPADLVVIGLKATANAALESILPPLLKPETVLLTLQNGLGNEEFLAGRWGAERVVGGACFTCINRLSPGVLSHTAGGKIEIGEFTGPLRPRTEAIARMFAESLVPCQAKDSLASIRWQKLVWNIPFNGLAIAGGGITTKDILENPALNALLIPLMEEIIAAARALGAEVPDGWAEHQVSRTAPMKDYRPSSMIDFVEGREVEVEAIWGEPWRRAAAAGAPAARMETLYRVIDGLVRQRLNAAKD